MSQAQWLWAIAAVAVASYLLRVAPLLWRRLHAIAGRNVVFLSYIAFAIAAGIVSKAVVIERGGLAAPDVLAVKFAAVLAAIAVFRLAGHLPLALFAGVTVAVLLKAWAG